MEFKIAVAGPNGREETLSYDSYRTRESARYVLGCGLRRLVDDARAYGYRISAINGEPLPESLLSKYLEESFDLLLDRVIPVMSFAYSMREDGLNVWMAVFGQLPTGLDDVHARFMGRYGSRDKFVALHNAEAFGLDRESAEFKSTNWHEAWDKLGYSTKFIFRDGFAFCLDPDDVEVESAVPEAENITITLAEYNALIASRKELAAALESLEAESFLDEDPCNTEHAALAKATAVAALNNYRSRLAASSKEIAS